MAESVRLVPVNDDHIAPLFTLLNDVYRIEVGTEGVGFKKDGQERYHDVRELEELRSQGYITVAEDTITGEVVGCIFYKYFYDPSDPTIRRCYFGPFASIRKGVGKLLLLHLEKLVHDTHEPSAISHEPAISSIDIRVVSCRTDVLPMYQKHGYEIIREEPFPEPEVCVREVFFYVLRKTIEFRID